MDIAKLMQEISPNINSVGGAYYFTPETLARGKELGLNGLQFYYLGRGGVLGNAEWPVVAGAFGYFAPRMVEKFWTSASAIMAPRDGGRAYVACSHDFGRRHLSGVEGLDAFCAAAEKVNQAIDPASLTLYAGLKGEPLPADLPARAYHLVTLLREHRGSVHLLAIVASGLSPHMADAIRSADNYKLHGYTEEEMPVPADAHRALMVEADILTDRLMCMPYAVLDDQERASLLAGLQSIKAALSNG